MSLFDAYIFLDWSAAKARAHGANSIWLAEKVGAAAPKAINPPTRSECIAKLLKMLEVHLQHGRRVLLGFDFSYGYPSGLANALHLNSPNPPWQQIWAYLAASVQDDIDGNRNANNRWNVASGMNAAIAGAVSGPFWGCPPAAATPNLLTTSPGFPFALGVGIAPLQRLRITEQRLPRVHETWKLYTAGSVGSQVLMGIPRLHQLRQHASLANCSQVWPMETGFTPTPGLGQRPYILHAEIWPGTVAPDVKALLAQQPNLIRDEAQVLAMCQWAFAKDVVGQLSDYLRQPEGLTPQQVEQVVCEEGWILGSPLKPRD